MLSREVVAVHFGIVRNTYTVYTVWENVKSQMLRREVNVVTVLL